MKIKRILPVLLLFMLFFALTSCDFGLDGETPVGTGGSEDSDFTLPDAFTTRKAISYSGYRTGQSPDTQVYPSEDEILEDLEILEQMGFTLLRLYDTGTHAERVLNVINSNELDIKIMQGIWIYGDKSEYDTENLEGCDQAIEWANGDYSEIIIAVSVGNEAMVDWSGYITEPADIAEYVTYVKSAITQPVTVDDNWEPWSMEDESGTEGPYGDVELVAEAVDFITIHTYAIFDAYYNLWDYKQDDVAESDRADAMMEASVDYAEENYLAVKSALSDIGINKPIIIGETGWKHVSESTTANLGHPVNQEIYYQKMKEWVYDESSSPEACFFFEAFDEPWKDGDDGWGFFNVDREANYIVYSNDEWADVVVETGIADDVEYTESDAYYVEVMADVIEVTDSIFHVFADVVTTGYDGQVAGDSTNLQWEPWGSTTATADYLTAEGQEADGDLYITEISPVPESWGWGMMAFMLTQGFDLTDFSAGNLVFDIRTEYDGILEVGCQTGLGADSDSMDLLVELDPSSNSYGYENDGSWYEVTIPVADLISAAEISYENASDTTVNLEKVYIPFVIGDRVSPIESTEIYLDNIRWEQ